MKKVNEFMLTNVRIFEMIGVVMRISSFSLVSWLGAKSPFIFVWIFNTIDAILLSYCSVLRKDKAYSMLNIFWIAIGIIGILRATGIMK
jgi:hypothetical protein